MTQTARELCHKGRRQQLTPDGHKQAKQHFDDAIKQEPGYMPAHAESSYVYVREYQNAWGTSRAASLAEARKRADEAVAIARTTPEWADDFRALWYSAIVSWNEGDFDRSFREYKEARDLIKDPERINKDTADLDADMAEALIYNGEPDRAIDLILAAMDRYPDYPKWYLWNLARAYYMAGRYQDAINAIDAITPNDLRLIRAASKAQLGELDHARLIMAEFSKNDPDWSVEKSAEYNYRNDGDRQRWLDGLRKAGLKEK